jgi:hypothetical protein
VRTSDLGFPPPETEEIDLGLALEDPVETIADLAAADLGRRSFLTTSAYSVYALGGALAFDSEAVARGTKAVRSGGDLKVGGSDVEAVRAITTAFAAMDERMGGEHGRTAVVTYLAEDVSALCRGAMSATVRSAMFAAAAEIAYLAGWKAHDSGKESLAQRYYLQAFGLASEGDPTAHAGYVLRIMAHLALDIGRPERSLDLAQAAWARANGRTGPHTMSLFALTLARAHAGSGETARATSWLATAEALAAPPLDQSSVRAGVVCSVNPRAHNSSNERPRIETACEA